MRCHVSISDSTRIRPPVAKYALESRPPPPAPSARKAATSAHTTPLSIDVTCSTARRARIAKAKVKLTSATGARAPSAPPARGASSRTAIGRNNGWHSSAIRMACAPSTASASRPGRASSPRSGSQASAARSSGSRIASAPNITRPRSPPLPSTGAHRSSARSASSRAPSVKTRRLRSKRQARRMPPPSTTSGYAGSSGHTAARSRTECNATVRATRRTAPGSRRSRTVFTADSMPRSRGPALLLGGWGADVQVAAAVAAGLPGVGGEGEASRFEGAVVHAAGDPAERGDVLIGQSRLAPGVLQRAAHEGDVEPARIAARDVRREHAAVVGHAAHEGVAQPAEVARREARELAPDLRAARIDRPAHDLARPRFAELGAQLAEDVPVHQRPILERPVYRLPQRLVTHRWRRSVGWAGGGAAGPCPLRFLDDVDVRQHVEVDVAVDDRLAELVLLQAAHGRLGGCPARHPRHRDVAGVRLHDLLGLGVVGEALLGITRVAPGLELLVE